MFFQTLMLWSHINRRWLLMRARPAPHGVGSQIVRSNRVFVCLHYWAVGMATANGRADTGGQCVVGGAANAVRRGASHCESVGTCRWWFVTTLNNRTLCAISQSFSEFRRLVQQYDVVLDALQIYLLIALYHTVDIATQVSWINVLCIVILVFTISAVAWRCSIVPTSADSAQ